MKGKMIAREKNGQDGRIKGQKPMEEEIRNRSETVSKILLEGSFSKEAISQAAEAAKGMDGKEAEKTVLEASDKYFRSLIPTIDILRIVSGKTNKALGIICGPEAQERYKNAEQEKFDRAFKAATNVLAREETYNGGFGGLPDAPGSWMKRNRD